MDKLMLKYYRKGQNDREIADSLADHGLLTTAHKVRCWRVKNKLDTNYTAKGFAENKEKAKARAEQRVKTSESCIDLTKGMKVVVLDREEVESRLKREFGCKLEPVTTATVGRDKGRLLSGIGWRECPVNAIGKAEG